MYINKKVYMNNMIYYNMADAPAAAASSTLARAPGGADVMAPRLYTPLPVLAFQSPAFHTVPQPFLIVPVPLAEKSVL